MNQNETSIYVGSGKIVHRNDQEPYFRVELDLDQLEDGMEDSHLHRWTDKRGVEHRVLKLILSPLRSENQTEFRTHSLKIDTWKPDRTKSKQQVKSTPKPMTEAENNVRASFAAPKEYDATTRRNNTDDDSVPF